jgi:hypothetical protein
VIAAPVLGLWLSSQPRLRMGSGLASRISPIVLCAVNPIVIVCIGFGHAEDVLGASLCVAAVVLAVRGSGGWAGLLVGLAVVNKSWALVAVPVVLAVMPSGQRRALMIIVGTAASILLPVLIVIAAPAAAVGLLEGRPVDPLDQRLRDRPDRAELDRVRAHLVAGLADAPSAG